MSKFKHNDLKLTQPTFDSEITDLIIELDYLRMKQLQGSTHPQIFFQLKQIFHMLESIGSARIEGNHTTIAEYIETTLDQNAVINESIIEIRNMEKALTFIDNHILNTDINRVFLSELHKIVVNNLTTEGSITPGEYRKKNVVIAGANFCPPNYTNVLDYMEELLKFINNNDSSKYDLLKTAITHHRFAWIHPFDNGNGRTVRLLTYAMLVKLGFNIHVGRIINPTAIFCSNRSIYYKYLSKADSGEENDILEWCYYVLSGLKKEIEKIDKLLDYNYVAKTILLPAIRYSKERGLLTDTEKKILDVAIKKQVFQNSDLQDIFKNKKKSEISRWIRRMKERNLIETEQKSSRKYVITFSHNQILRGIIKSLGDNNFLPLKNEDCEK
ncbi:MAG: Fic family protein [Candidatus Cloacimonetes bacterium]|nr:Fic family protein [Candidatus Cloacimonadota bacterium]MBT7470132.1 Fic family protein [Candidatus Cloacimonadota bacterium]